MAAVFFAGKVIRSMQGKPAKDFLALFCASVRHSSFNRHIRPAK